MKTTKRINEDIIALMDENRDKLELIRDVRSRAKKDKNLGKDNFENMKDSWNLQEWLIIEIVQPALQQALINQSLKNF
jgi:hypothetical protein